MGVDDELSPLEIAGALLEAGLVQAFVRVLQNRGDRVAVLAEIDDGGDRQFFGVSRQQHGQRDFAVRNGKRVGQADADVLLHLVADLVELLVDFPHEVGQLGLLEESAGVRLVEAGLQLADIGNRDIQVRVGGEQPIVRPFLRREGPAGGQAHCECQAGDYDPAGCH